MNKQVGCGYVAYGILLAISVGNFVAGYYVGSTKYEHELNQCQEANQVLKNGEDIRFRQIKKIRASMEEKPFGSLETEINKK